MAEKKKPEGGGLGEFLQNLRETARLTLREVEAASGVSNAYLSQLEHGKIEKPSPHILHKLAAVYRIAYESLMEKAGYLLSGEAGSGKQGGRRGRLATFANQEISEEEEEELLRYLAFLRSRKSKK